MQTRQHDYREVYWGHNHFMREQAEGAYHGLAISQNPINVGDTLLWKTAYGECVSEVTHSRRMLDPNDMYEVESRVVERRIRRDILSDNTPPWDEYTIID